MPIWQKPLPNHWDDVASVLFIYYRFNKDEEEDPSEFEAELAMLDDIENEMKEEMDVPDDGGKGGSVSAKTFLNSIGIRIFGHIRGYIS